MAAPGFVTRELPPEPGIPGGAPPWSRPGAAAAAAAGVDPACGLTGEEAERRLATAGRNELPGDRSRRPGDVLRAQFRSLVVWVLLGASALSWALGERVDAAAIAGIVVLNAVIGFYQEWRAERALAALRALAAPRARVLRGARAALVPAGEVVPGDVLLLEAGDRPAADARLLEAIALRVDEASLTGESTPVDKDAGLLLSPETPLADRANMVYQGTGISAGQGRAVVTATGSATEMGHIAALIRSARPEATPLQRRLDRVGRDLLVASLGVVGLVFALGLLRGEAFTPMLLTAVSLAVAAVPEGLPAVVTVVLALGVARMARRHALVRRLSAVETLGSAQVICSDKTGTLTAGAMTVRGLWTGGRELAVSGAGYAPEGEFTEAGRLVEPGRDAALASVLHAGAACSDAELRITGERAGILGDPTEGALLVAAAKAGIHREALEVDSPRLRVLPFDAARRRMTVVRSTPAGPRAYVKGAPDTLLSRCTAWLGPDGARRPLGPAEREAILAAAERFAGRALRVIAVAGRAVAGNAALGMAGDVLERDLTLLGLQAMYDPPRPEAKEAIARCRRAGIRTVMITGDHPATAAAVARELELLQEGGEVLSGTELQALDDQELRDRVPRVAVYARVTAEDKLRLVRAFRELGLVVAMTGDGVNDAPAVKQASIGIAMGLTGTEVTREAADMVVTDDNFASIVAAVEEGRGIYDNIKKCLQYLLAGNAAEIALMLAAALLGWPVPLLPIHLLWINLVTDGLPALALATDPAAPDVMDRSPRPPNEQITDRGFVKRLLLAAALDAAVSMSAFWWGWQGQGSVAAARCYAFSTLVFAELLRSLGARSALHAVWHPAGRPNPRLVGVVLASVAIQVLILQVPALQAIFRTHAMPVSATFALLALGAVPLTVLELVKRVERVRGSRLNPA